MAAQHAANREKESQMLRAQVEATEENERILKQLSEAQAGQLQAVRKEVMQEVTIVYCMWWRVLLVCLGRTTTTTTTTIPRSPWSRTWWPIAFPFFFSYFFDCNRSPAPFEGGRAVCEYEAQTRRPRGATRRSETAAQSIDRQA